MNQSNLLAVFKIVGLGFPVSVPDQILTEISSDEYYPPSNHNQSINNEI